MKTQQRTVVVGVAGSPASRAALHWAMDLASAQGFHVAAVAVQRRIPAFMPASSMALHPYGSPPQPTQAARAEQLHSIVGKHNDNVSEHLLSGEPARELTRMAGPGDLLVIGRGGLLSGVTMACVRHARCPVVVVLAGKKE
ncbi:nucleotide-binding universal stress UspA family protein [Kibdelosporangium banguiense]|uniref:Nucleotide-binding universal stress UspA family protein n=1 Tax=Kibdelosporangium banguiense TaxID=1365924 RepID=A0ABS4TWM4_9PSEU|nr:universal stress protein [Kibdelosporangium banguiense]MBP2328768.1 nucleotide-binding universal stress UspA family protein [Kibdelosporangium banguiense]